MKKRFLLLVLTLSFVAMLFSGCELFEFSDPAAKKMDTNGQGYRLLVVQGNTNTSEVNTYFRDVYHYNEDGTIASIMRFDSGAADGIENAVWEKICTDTYSYDKDGHLIEIECSNEDFHNYSYEYTFTSDGYSVSTIDKWGKHDNISFYDLSDHLLKQQSFEVGQIFFETVFTYDDAWHILTETQTYPNGQISYETVNEYRADGSLQKSTSKGYNYVAVSDFDEKGHLMMQTTEYCAEGTTTSYRYELEYSSDGYLLSSSEYYKFDEPERTDEYDREGHVVKTTYYSNGNFHYEKVYEYNDHGDLTGWHENWANGMDGRFEEYIYSKD